jgi:hypothetical protein
MTGAELIAAERKRQIEVEGWTAEHDDDAHGPGSLTNAAIAYAGHARTMVGKANLFPPQCWPWDRRWWKPSDDQIRNLVKAGALIAAEIDRLQRATDH